MFPDRKATVYNEVVAINRDNPYTEVIVLEDIFEYNHGLKGATGMELILVPQEEIDRVLEEENKIEYFRELWQQAVADGDTEESLTEWADNFNEDTYLDMVYEEPQDWDIHKAVKRAGFVEGEDYARLSISSLGRIFPRALDEDNVEIVKPELEKLIREVETVA